MNILILNWRDIKHPQAGGAEVYFHEIAKEWIKKGNNVTWISGGWKNCVKNENVDGIKIKRIGNSITLYLLAPFAYFSLTSKPDAIVDVENGIPFFSPIYSRKKILLHIHHVHKEVWSKQAEAGGLKEKFLAPIGYFLEMVMMPWIYKNKRITTLSKSSKKAIENYISKKVVGIISPGITQPKQNNFKKSIKPSVLFFNRIKKYKGIDIFLRAIAGINKSNLIKDIELNIAGTGDYLEEAKTLAKELKIEKKVNFLGHVTEKEKQVLLKKSWVLINPSFVEGWGIVNIEANSFGTPVIGSNVNGIKDSVINKKTGLLFEYGNEKELSEKIIYLIKNPSVRKKMSEQAKQFSKKFTWKNAAETFLKILKNQ